MRTTATAVMRSSLRTRADLEAEILALRHRVGRENTSGCQDVFVNHTAETIAALDTSFAALRRWRH